MKQVIRHQDLSKQEHDHNGRLLQLFNSSPIPEEELLANLGLFIKRQDMMRILMLHELYSLCKDIPGDIYEFGVRWGQNLSLFTTFRGIYEPYNFTRRIFGFDTFSGFVGVQQEDGKHNIMHDGAYAVTEGYENYLENVLDTQACFSPTAHIKRFKLYKGDASVALEEHFSAHPESIVSLAYFDFDIYRPTLECLNKIRPRLTKGSVVAFDELNHSTYPGETQAVADALGLSNISLRRPVFSSSQAYFIVE